MNEILLYELTEGPLADELAPLITAGDDAGIVAALNRKDISTFGKVYTADFNTWCSGHNAEYLRITALAKDEASPLHAAANSLLRILSGAMGERVLNLGAPSVAYLVSIWPFVDESSRASFMSLGATTVSRAEQLGIYVTNKDVINVIWNTDGSRRLT